MRSLRYLLMLPVLVAPACGREGPTAVGSSLLPASGIHTFEVVLDAPDFLQADTTVSGFAFASSAGFRIVAQSFGGSVFAHTLARFGALPSTLTVRDTANNQVTDTLPRFPSGRLVLYVDSTADNGTVPIALQLFRTTEQWDALTASWTMRVDSGQTHLPWAQPGGTVSPLLSSATWNPGDDSVSFTVDSATIVALTDTANHARGALIAATTAGTRLRSSGVQLTLLAKSRIRPDTTVLVNASLQGHTFIFTPAVPLRTGIVQAGGAPVWRAFFVFRPDLWTRSFPCPASVGIPCTFTLKDVKVNSAALLLTPAPPGGFPPEDSLRLRTWVVDTASFVPLSRSPLGAQVGALIPAVSPATFLDAAAAGTPLAVPVTAFVAAAAGDTLTIGSGAAVSRTVALVAVDRESATEPALFGVAAFYGRNGAAHRPRLRLVLTLGSEVQLP